ncbi:hypothetical protein B296_00003341, partial [Ensete ventricosum]
GTRRGSRLQGDRKGLLPTASPATSRGGDASGMGGHPLAARLPTGKGNRRLIGQGQVHALGRCGWELARSVSGACRGYQACRGYWEFTRMA